MCTITLQQINYACGHKHNEFIQTLTCVDMSACPGFTFLDLPMRQDAGKCPLAGCKSTPDTDTKEEKKN